MPSGTNPEGLYASSAGPDSQRMSTDEWIMPGENQESLSGDEGRSALAEDWLATTIDVQELAAANPAVAPHSCPHCREWELDLRNNTFNHITQQGHGQTQISLTGSYAREKAELGCLFFERSLSTVIKSHPERPLSKSEFDDAIVSVFSGTPDPHQKFSISWKNGNIKAYNESYEIYMPHDTRPPTGVLAGRVPPNLVPNSNLSYRRINSWIDDCKSNHAKCSARPRDFMPSRVLHVSGTGEEPTIRLSTDHPTEPYAALSYCWGADQPAKTTRAKLGSYLNNINFSTLPSTIRDAAIVTRGMGLSYLWVDAMCIVQDDFDDVMTQIAQMHAIYHSSWVTIAAAEALTCNHGFLQPRSKWQPIRMRARLDESGPSEVLLVPEGKSWRTEAPLFQRGWTMQETLLSSRILLYGQRELIFLCLEGERCEGADLSDVRHYQTYFDPGSNLYVKLDHPEGWGYLVSAYSQRLLAVEGDKLLGIAALAENYGRTRAAGDYLAGMWREKFLEQCLWITESFPADGRVAKHPKTYRAPSWSWASVDGRISCFGVSANTPLMVLPETMGPNVTCEVVDVQTTLTVAENPFGMVSGGYLVMRGRLRQVVWRPKQGNWTASGHLEGGTRQALDSRMTFMMDCEQEWEGGGDVLLWSLEICNTDKGSGYAILLQEAGHHDGSFQRVGRLDIDEAPTWRGNWFETEYEIREVRII